MLGRRRFLRLDNVGIVSARQIEKAIGWEDPQMLQVAYSPPNNMARVADALERIVTNLEGKMGNNEGALATAVHQRDALAEALCEIALLKDNFMRASEIAKKALNWSIIEGKECPK